MKGHSCETRYSAVSDASVAKKTSQYRGTSGGIKNAVRRPLLATALASLLAAVLLVPTAQAYTYSTVNRFFQEDALNLGRPSVLVNVVYNNTHRNGKFTPRLVYIQFQVPVSCQVGGNSVVVAASGPFKLRKGKVEFANSYFSQGFSYSVTGQEEEEEEEEEASRRNSDRLGLQLAPNVHQLHQRWPPPLLRYPMPVGHSSEQAVAALLSAKVGLTA